MKYTIRKTTESLAGTIALAGSKSLANRALIIRALCPEPFEIQRLANARDTQLLDALLQSNDQIRNAGAAGTTFRFLTAYLSAQPGTQILTGTDRMKHRPVGLLVEALRQLGADIEYLERDGYPPLQIGEARGFGARYQIRMPAGTSSQFISALLMIAPNMPKGLELTLEGRVVSRPYIEMTLNLMRYFGAEYEWEDSLIRVRPKPYQGRPFSVEADWSAASYYYALAAFSAEPDLHLQGLYTDSVQGDAVLAEMMEAFGIQTAYTPQGIHLTRISHKLPESFEWDFLRCPDLAQTLAVVCVGLGVPASFTGLETLRIKETDRIAALQQELAKVGGFLRELPPSSDGRQYYQISGKARLNGRPTFATYEDHRMAMAFAPLALLGEIDIEEPEVVEKSYPDFWTDLNSLGLDVGLD